MSIAIEITSVVSTALKDGTVEKLVFVMTATETDDATGERIAQASVDAAIENPAAGDIRDTIIQYANDNDWKQLLFDRLEEKKLPIGKTVQPEVLAKTVVDDIEIALKTP